MTDAGPAYVLGSDPHELERLDQQAAAIGPATRLLLRAAGIEPGMRVLDLGTGPAGPRRPHAGGGGGAGRRRGGVDQAAAARAVARRRVQEQGLGNVRFVQADATTWRDDEPFDAVVERLLLFHTADPVAVVRHHTAGLRPEGVVACIDFDVGGARTFPAVPLATQVAGRLEAGFRHGGADPPWARLAQILKAAGLRDVGGFGVVAYLAPDDPSGPRFIAGVARSLLPVITAAGIATAEQVGIDTLEGRVADDMRATDAVFMPPTVVGAWGPLDPRRLAAPPGLI